jgi:hypothetical protein
LKLKGRTIKFASPISVVKRKPKTAKPEAPAAPATRANALPRSNVVGSRDLDPRVWISKKNRPNSDELPDEF